jgi:cystathionine beta-lyase/cystathionine gamma-synthase
VAVAVGRAGCWAAVEQSCRDLAEDFDELVFVALSAADRLEAALVEVERAGEGVLPALAGRVCGEGRALIDRLRLEARELGQLAQEAGAATDGGEIEALAGERCLRAELLRAELGLVAALVTATDWQSPSFGHSVSPCAGRQAGLIVGHETDYKRDRHLDAQSYEQAYVREFVGEGTARALMTSCGMSAFTTILGFLLCEGLLRDRYVVIGRGLYHETKELLYGAIPSQVIEMDELVPPSIALAIEKFRPAAVFFDSLANTSRAPAIDLEWLMGLFGEGAESTFVVIDVTGTTAAGLPRLFPPPEGVRLVLFESLLKYCQLGFDRANAGVVVAWGEDAEALSRYREHLGTNVPDTAVHTLPPPNRAILLRRLARLERNARLVAERLEEAVAQARGRLVCEIVSPLLESHPSHPIAARLPFAGSCLALRLAAGYEQPTWRQRLVEQALTTARRRGIRLIAGSSFGFDTTRIYVTADSAEYGEPFVRVAAGTEHRRAIGQLADALADTLIELSTP